MKQVTKLMIEEFNLKKLNHDFMGYTLQKGDIYTFHHMIIPARQGGKYERWNGAILCGQTAHPYLHIIEGRNYDMFLYITGELVQINQQGYISSENIRKIHNVLCLFEREHCGERTRKGKILIKEEYTKRIYR